MREKTENSVDLRNKIIDAMKEMEDEWMTADSIFHHMLSTKAIKKDVTLEMVGNNLRVMKNSGMVSDTKIDDRRCWALTGSEKHMEVPVRMVVAFPKYVHERLTEEATKRGTSKTNLIIKSVQDSIQ